VEWQAGYQSPLMMSVNLSGKHFATPNLVDQIDAVLDATFLDPGSLKLEITESAVMENAEAAISMLHKIKKSGVKISIDDFGTGYSSLSYLQRFPIDTLKVDRSFVSMMGEKSENGAIVRTVVTLAKALQLNVVAEGVETPDQFQRLRGLGCEYGQGYLFSRPLPSEGIEELLDDTDRWSGMLHGSPLVQHEDMATIDRSFLAVQ
jgi:EAL domain-containing protein (putative c-di-GMP-specific phosphodiesterase class I)